MWYRSSGIVRENNTFTIDTGNAHQAMGGFGRRVQANEMARTHKLHKDLSNHYDGIDEDHLYANGNTDMFQMSRLNAHDFTRGTPFESMERLPEISNKLGVRPNGDEYNMMDVKIPAQQIGATLYDWNAAGVQQSVGEEAYPTNMAYLSAAVREFADLIQNPQTAHYANSPYYQRIHQIMEDSPELMQLFQNILRHEYDHTQNTLDKMRANRTVRLFRGMNVPTEKYDHLPGTIRARIEEIEGAKQPVHFDNVPFKLQPISSFTAAPHIAKDFSEQNEKPGLRLMNYVDVPRHRILSTPFTGKGMPNEEEYTVLGGDDLHGGVAAWPQGVDFAFRDSHNDRIYK